MWRYCYTRRMTQLDAQALAAVRHLVNAALDAAAAVTLPHFRQPIAVDNKAADGFDPVTVADRDAEQCLRDILMAGLPHASFLGEEESVAHNNSGLAEQIAILDIPPHEQANLAWVVDPIDGTRAFITGAPLWGTLVALSNANDVLFGALDQPWLGERFIGQNNLSERVSADGIQSIATRPPRPIQECILQTTSPDMFVGDALSDGFARVRDAVAMTRYGGDCYAYALLAMGGIDAVVEADLQPYDIQALIPIVRGAGGIVSNWRGDSCMQGGDVVASSCEAVHEQILKKLAI